MFYSFLEGVAVVLMVAGVTLTLYALLLKVLDGGFGGPLRPA